MTKVIAEPLLAVSSTQKRWNSLRDFPFGQVVVVLLAHFSATKTRRSIMNARNDGERQLTADLNTSHLPPTAHADPGVPSMLPVESCAAEQNRR